MKRVLAGFVAGALLAGGVAVWLGRAAPAGPAPSAQVAEQLQTGLFGSTRSADYLASANAALSGQTQLVAARLRRDEKFTRMIRREQLVFTSDALVEIRYQVEYVFGFDLAPGRYELRDTGRQLEIRLGAPQLLAVQVLSQNHDAPVRGWLIDEDRALNTLYREIPAIVQRQGRQMLASPEIAALCEKQLIAFVADFLARQPGVTRVPHIVVTRWPAPPFAATSAAASAAVPTTAPAASVTRQDKSP
ncbi:MAG: hypothetical protein AB9M60_21550 [Leptothrix sp. (in: b-proteobacteria)]